MRGHILRTLGVALVAAPLAISARAGTGQTGTAGVGKGDVQGEVTRTSRPVRLLRSWEETVKLPGGGEYPRRVDVVFDYDAGVGYANFYALDGRPTGREALGAGQPAPSPEEIQEAYGIVRADPEFALLFKRFHVVFEGGFVLVEGKGSPCGPGSRCLRVFLLSSDRAGTIRQLVVDLVKEKVAYDDFSAEPWRSGR
jgi:hypothetical protein